MIAVGVVLIWEIIFRSQDELVEDPVLEAEQKIMWLGQQWLRFVLPRGGGG